MRLHLTPVRMGGSLQLERRGQCLRINGVDFDFTPLAVGAQLPLEALNGDCFTAPVIRDAKGLRIALRLPHGPLPRGCNPQAFEIDVPHDGPIPLPSPFKETTA